MKKNELGKKWRLAGFLAAVVMLGGCGSSDRSASYDAGEGEYALKAEGAQYNMSAATDMAADYEMTDAMPMEEATEMKSVVTGNGEGGTSAIEVEQGAVENTNRKLIREIALELETKDFPSLVEALKTQTKNMGGYIENSYEYNGSNYQGRKTRNANLTLRIPSNRVDEFVGKASEAGNVISQNENTRDVTLSYVDIDSHKRMLQAEAKRLMELMEQVEDIEDMIYLESRLTEIRYQIESMESQLRTYDNKVDYSTVNVNVVEVVELTEIKPDEPEPTPMERMKEGFVNSVVEVAESIRDFFVDVVIALPHILVTLLVIFIIFLILKAIIQGIIRKVKKSGRRKAERKTGEMPAHVAEAGAETGAGAKTVDMKGNETGTVGEIKENDGAAVEKTAENQAENKTE